MDGLGQAAGLQAPPNITTSTLAEWLLQGESLFEELPGRKETGLKIREQRTGNHFGCWRAPTESLASSASEVGDRLKKQGIGYLAVLLQHHEHRKAME